MPIDPVLPLVRVRLYRTTNNAAVSPDAVTATPTVSHVTSNAHGYHDLVPVTSTADSDDPGALYLDLVATDDTDVAEKFAWRITFTNSERPTRLVSVPQTGAAVETIVTADGDEMPAVWLDALEDFTGYSGPTASGLATSGYVDQALDLHEQAADPHPGYALETAIEPRLLPATAPDGRGVRRVNGTWVAADDIPTTNALDALATSTTQRFTSLTDSLADVATSGDAADLTGLLAPARLPESARRDRVWRDVADETAMLALPARRGDIAIRADRAGTNLPGWLVLAEEPASTLANWASVPGRTLTKADIGLGNVADLAPADLPISTATQAALDAVPELARDTIGAALVAGTNITVDVNDAANTITISSSGGPSGGADPEQVRDLIGTTIVAGTGISVTVDDAGDTVTIAGTFGVEEAQDAVAALFAAGSHTGIAFDYNDSSGALNVSVTGAVASVNGRTGTVTGLAEAADLTAHTGRSDNPHAVTKAQVGLGAVDNTADTAKPVSTAQQAALDAKVPTSRTVASGSGLTGGGSLAADRTLSVVYGTGAGTAAEGNDPRIVNAVQTSQRGPIGGVVSLGSIASGATVTPDASFGSQFSGTAAAGGFTLAAASGATVGQVYAVFVTASGANRTVTLGAGITALKRVAATNPTSFTITSGKLAAFLFRAKSATTATLLDIDEEV